MIEHIEGVFRMTNILHTPLQILDAVLIREYLWNAHWSTECVRNKTDTALLGNDTSLFKDLSCLCIYVIFVEGSDKLINLFFALQSFCHSKFSSCWGISISQNHNPPIRLYLYTITLYFVNRAGHIKKPVSGGVKGVIRTHVRVLPP